ncbi:MAG: hypothetical protein WD273_12890 [Trueperaceae bacterium]
MSRFSVGEEVRYDDDVYVVSSVTAVEPFRYRLLASRTGGTRFVFAQEGQLKEMESYLRPRDDTLDY